MTSKTRRFSLPAAELPGGLDLITVAFLSDGERVDPPPPRPAWLPSPQTADAELSAMLQEWLDPTPRQCWRNSFVSLSYAERLAAERGLGQVYYCEGIGTFPLGNTGRLWPAEHGFIVTESGTILETTWDPATIPASRYYIGLRLTVNVLLRRLNRSNNILPLSVYSLKEDRYSAAYRNAVDAAYYDCYGVFPLQIAAAFAEKTDAFTLDGGTE